MQAADCEPDTALIIAVPAATGVTMPFATVATLGLLVSHDTGLPVGVVVAVSEPVSPPAVRLRVEAERLIAVALLFTRFAIVSGVWTCAKKLVKSHLSSRSSITTSRLAPPFVNS